MTAFSAIKRQSRLFHSLYALLACLLITFPTALRAEGGGEQIPGKDSPHPVLMEGLEAPPIIVPVSLTHTDVSARPATSPWADRSPLSLADPFDYTLPDTRFSVQAEETAHQSISIPGPADMSYHLPALPEASPYRYRNFGQQAGAVKWEMAAIIAYYTAINGSKLFEDPQWPHFHKEGWFGKSTHNIGVDKLAHSYSSYVLSEILHARLRRKTGDAPGIEFTAAALASATMLYTELWDSIEPSAGWSWEDVTFNTLGAGFSILRNAVPGLDEKLDFRLMIVPNSSFINTQGKRHFEQQRHFFALKFAGFDGVNKGPLRFLEFHLGYYAKDFTLQDRASGIEPKRRIFVGFGLNLRELFFKNSSSRIGRTAGEVLDYFQPPYTAVHQHITN